MLYLLIAIIIIEYIFEEILDYLNSTKWSNSLPSELDGIYNARKYQESQDYERKKQRLKNIMRLSSLTIIILMLSFGGFAYLDNFARSIADQPILSALLFFAILLIAADIIAMPFAVYKTFVIEEKYGFNKTTKRIFILDHIKGWIVTGILGSSALSLIVWFYLETGDMFWIYAWLASSAFVVLMAMFSTTLIIPLFNKLSPLQDGDLKSRIQVLCDETRFDLDNVFVMDGSKRSAKANAFFSGLGVKKRIVLFDTLIDSLSAKEVIAVVAHEIGHYKKKHVLKGITTTIFKMGLIFYLLSLVIDNPLLSSALGSERHSFQLGIVAFVILYKPVSLAIGLLSMKTSRTHEYEADEYAKTYLGSKEMATALKKLSVNHLSNLNPHPAYVFVHYSHPPLLKRLGALNS